MCTRGGIVPIQDLFASLMGCSTSDYREMLVTWIHQYNSDIPAVSSWLALWGLNLDEYCLHLLSGGPADGLEVWLASCALGCLVNVVLENAVWATSWDGVDFEFPTFLLVTYNSAQWCDLVDEVENEMGSSTDTVEKLTLRKHVGRPNVKEVVNLTDDSMDQSSTDTEQLFEEEHVPVVMILPSGQP